MSALAISPAATHVSGGDYGVVAGILVLAVLALGVAGLFGRQVLAAAEGTVKMRDIARAVQERADAYLNRQFRTLAGFAVLIFAILFVLPADNTGARVGRSI